MKPKSRLTLAVLGLVSSVSVITAALALGNHIPGQLNSLITGLGGALGGISVTAILLELADRKRTPEQRKELARGEHDERNIAIREKAAMSSWYWTLGLLWGLFVLCLLLGVDPVYQILSSIVIVLHCLFYLMNICRWTKKM